MERTQPGPVSLRAGLGLGKWSCSEVFWPDPAGEAQQMLLDAPRDAVLSRDRLGPTLNRENDLWLK